MTLNGLFCYFLDYIFFGHFAEFGSCGDHYYVRVAEERSIMYATKSSPEI